MLKSMAEIRQDQRRMVELLETLGSAEGARASRVPGVTLLRARHYAPPMPVLYEPCIVVVAQGLKRFHLPDRVVTYDARNYLVLTVPVPGDCETEVYDDLPFLGIAVRIDLALLSDLLIKLGGKAESLPKKTLGEWVSAPSMTPLLADVVIRLLTCLGSETDAGVLGPQLVRELTYRVLCGQEGGALQDLLLANGTTAQIHRVLHRMHTCFAAPLNIPTLAREAGMSVSGLHQHFKSVVGTSPVQYLKIIRLHKARMMMIQDFLGAAGAATRVGYESPSQFSREFKRLFGAPPADEAQRVRSTFGISA